MTSTEQSVRDYRHKVTSETLKDWATQASERWCGPFRDMAGDRRSVSPETLNDLVQAACDRARDRIEGIWEKTAFLPHWLWEQAQAHYANGYDQRTGIPAPPTQQQREDILLHGLAELNDQINNIYPGPTDAYAAAQPWATDSWNVRFDGKQLNPPFITAEQKTDDDGFWRLNATLRFNNHPTTDGYPSISESDDPVRHEKDWYSYQTSWRAGEDIFQWFWSEWPDPDRYRGVTGPYLEGSPPLNYRIVVNSGDLDIDGDIDGALTDWLKGTTPKGAAMPQLFIDVSQTAEYPIWLNDWMTANPDGIFAGVLCEPLDQQVKTVATLQGGITADEGAPCDG